MRSLISVLEAKVGKKEADNANEILSKVLSSRAGLTGGNSQRVQWPEETASPRR